MSKILVIGSINQDIVVNVKNMPQIGETVIAESSSMFFGGKGANQAIACSKLGGDCSFIGKLGKDEFGKKIIENFLENGVNTKGVIESENDLTGLALISVDNNGDNSIIVMGNANSKITYDEILENKDLIDSCDFILLQLEIPYEIVKKIISFCFEKGKKIILNPAPGQLIEAEILKMLYCITPNEGEICEILGEKNQVEFQSFENKISRISELGKKVVEMGVSNCAITMGSLGVIYVNKNDIFHYEGFKVIPVDTTGAGDTFNGALTYYLSQGYSFPKAILNSQGAAAISTLKLGAQSSMPDENQVMEFIRKNS